MAKNKNNNSAEDEKTKAKEEKRQKERERFEKRKQLEALAPEFFAMFGREGTDLLEVANVSGRENILNSVQIMMEELGKPGRLLRASVILREARLHGSIGVDGKGREDIHMLHKEKVEAQLARGGEAFG